MVGPGVHRVDERREGAPAVPRPPPADAARRPRLLRPAAARDPRGAGRRWRERVRRRGVLLLALLVRRRPPDPRAALHRGARQRRARRLVLPRLGEPDVDRHLARRRRPGPDRADLPGPEDDQAHFDAIVCRRSATRATSGSTAARCSTSSGPRSSPTPPRSSTAGSDGARGRPRRASTSSPRPATSSGAGRSTPAARRTASTRRSTSGSRSRTEPLRRARDARAAQAAPRLEVYPYAREPLPLPAGLDVDHYQPCRLPQLGQHTALRPPRPGAPRLVARAFRPHVRAAVDSLVGPARRRAAALGQVVERVGRGQPPRAGPASSATAGCRCSDEELAPWPVTDPLRIAMISYYLPSESKIGVGYQVHALATELADRGHDVDGAQRVRAGARRPLRPSAASVLAARLRTFRFATQLRRAGPVRLRRPARPWRRLLDVASAGPRATSAPSTARASRRRCTSGGSMERTRMVLLGLQRGAGEPGRRQDRRRLAGDPTVDALGLAP